MKYKIAQILILLLLLSPKASAENGSALWLRFDKEKSLPNITTINGNPTLTAVREVQRAWTEVSEKTLPISNKLADKTLIIGTAKDKNISSFGLKKQLQALGKEGYLIKTIRKDNAQQILIASEGEQGLLYGAFHFLRLIQTGQMPDNWDIAEKPTYNIRVLNHWDNLDGTVERGYAGYSLWDWEDLPQQISPRYEAYARANASIGINATVLNNVNASPDILRKNYLLKVKALADIFRPYGIKVYLSVNFSSPKILDNLPDSDPMNAEVIHWWKSKAKEIYTQIPDFGGFLVKANSEGQPGPQDYGRTHADGANMLADVLKPYGGVVMWRAFVYNPTNEDRAKQAYNEFLPLDGKFRDNVIVQVKNGPIDFQPREPFSPLFGGMKKTALMPELQITQEYLGHSNHLVYLAPLWKEFLENNTYCEGKNATVAEVTDGSFFPYPLTAIAGVANIGKDDNWTGHHFGQANWYAFGRLAWNHRLSAEEIADEWLRMTFTTNEDFVKSTGEMMLNSWAAAVDYMMPLGLHHIFAWDHHYGPEPWCDIAGARPDWLPRYYHNADKTGLGFDRTTKGSNAVSQYNSPLKERFNDVNSCPEDLILWFHHLPWDYTMKNGRSLWDELCHRYDRGVLQVRDFQKTWDRMETYVDKERFEHVQSRLKTQARDAVWWKDACLLYFQSYSGKPIPYDIERPVHELDELKKIKLDLKHHN